MSTLIKGNTTLEYINMDELRGRFKSLSLNALRESLAHSNLSSVPYMDRIEAQSKDPIWTNQTEQELLQLSYVSHKEEENNNFEKVKRNNNTFFICVENMNNNRANMNLSYRFESAPLAYSDSQPTNQN